MNGRKELAIIEEYTYPDSVLESNTVLIKGGDRWFRIPNQQGNSLYGQQGSPQDGGHNRTSQNYQHQPHAPPGQGENRGQTPVKSPRGRDAFQPGTDQIPSYQGNHNQVVQRVRPLGDQSSYAPPGQGEYRGNDRTHVYGHGPSSGTHGHGLRGLQSPGTGGSYGQGPNGGFYGQGPNRHGFSGLQGPVTSGSYGQGPSGGFYGQGPSGGFYGQGPSGGFYGQGPGAGGYWQGYSWTWFEWASRQEHVDFMGTGKDRVVDFTGRDRVVDFMDKDPVVDFVGKDRVVDFTGKDRVPGGYWQGHTHGHGLSGLQGPGTYGFYGHMQGPSGGFYGQGPSGGFYGQRLSAGGYGQGHTHELCLSGLQGPETGGSYGQGSSNGFYRLGPSGGFYVHCASSGIYRQGLSVGGYGYGQGPGAGGSGQGHAHGHVLSGLQGPGTDGSYGQAPSGGFYKQGPISHGYSQGPGAGGYGQGHTAGSYVQGLTAWGYGQGPICGAQVQGEKRRMQGEQTNYEYIGQTGADQGRYK